MQELDRAIRRTFAGTSRVRSLRIARTELTDVINKRFDETDLADIRHLDVGRSVRRPLIPVDYCAPLFQSVLFLSERRRGAVIAKDVPKMRHNR